MRTLLSALALSITACAAFAEKPNLFSAQPLAFERPAAAKVVGAYVPNWEPVAGQTIGLGSPR